MKKSIQFPQKARILKYSTLFSRWLWWLSVLRLDLTRLVCNSQLPTSATETILLYILYSIYYTIRIMYTHYTQLICDIILLQYWEHRNSETVYSKLINTCSHIPMVAVHGGSRLQFLYSEATQEDHKFKANPGYVRKACLGEKRGIEGYGDDSVGEVLAMQPWESEFDPQNMWKSWVWTSEVTYYLGKHLPHKLNGLILR